MEFNIHEAHAARQIPVFTLGCPSLTWSLTVCLDIVFSTNVPKTKTKIPWIAHV